MAIPAAKADLTDDTPVEVKIGALAIVVIFGAVGGIIVQMI